MLFKNVFGVILAGTLVIGARLASATSVPSSEREALVNLYLSNNGPNWKFNDNWLTTDPCWMHADLYNWYGVYCNSDGTHVVYLGLPSNFLNGTLPASLFDDLPYLTNLYLNGNALTGTIPSALWSLSLGDVSLASNSLLGSIPNRITNMTSLVYFNMESNSLTGTIPAAIDNLSNLKNGFYVQNNFLSGLVPSGICSIAKFNLDNNKFSCPLPSCCELLDPKYTSCGSCR